MPDFDKKIAHRILKMLARAEDDAATENEAKIAKDKAEKLMAKHGITRGELEDIDFEYRLVDLPFKSSPSWFRQISIGLKKLLGVFTVYSSRGTGNQAKYKVTGKPSDIDQYDYLLHSIKEQVEDLCDQWREEYKENHGGTAPSRRYTNDFRNACAQRVQNRLTAMIDDVSERQKDMDRDDDSTDLVLKRKEVEKKQEKAQRLMDKHSTYRSNSIRGARRNPGSKAGRKAGDKVSLNKGVQKNNNSKLAA